MMVMPVMVMTMPMVVMVVVAVPAETEAHAGYDDFALRPGLDHDDRGRRANRYGWDVLHRRGNIYDAGRGTVADPNAPVRRRGGSGQGQATNGQQRGQDELLHGFPLGVS